jgi:hypothetical protein
MIINLDKKLSLEEVIEIIEQAKNREQIIIKEGKKYIKFKPERRKENPDMDYIKIDEIDGDSNITEQKKREFFGLDLPYYLKIVKKV